MPVLVVDPRNTAMVATLPARNWIDLVLQLLTSLTDAGTMKLQAGFLRGGVGCDFIYTKE